MTKSWLVIIIVKDLVASKEKLHGQIEQLQEGLNAKTLESERARQQLWELMTVAEVSPTRTLLIPLLHALYPFLHPLFSVVAVVSIPHTLHDTDCALSIQESKS